VLFIVLYQREAHAGEMRFSEIEQPDTYEERLKLANKSCQELSIATLVVIDDMENSVREAYGRLPNSAYMIDKGGKIFHKEGWARPDNWGPILEELLSGKK
jgi:hypothetical protein